MATDCIALSHQVPDSKMACAWAAAECRFPEVIINVVLKGGLSWDTILGNWAAPTFILPGSQWPKSCFSVSQISLSNVMCHPVQQCDSRIWAEYLISWFRWQTEARLGRIVDRRSWEDPILLIMRSAKKVEPLPTTNERRVPTLQTTNASPKAKEDPFQMKRMIFEGTASPLDRN